jgi:hypothetical protein
MNFLILYLFLTFTLYSISNKRRTIGTQRWRGNMAKIEKVDKEWIQLIKEAKKLGLTKDEIRIFFKIKQKEGSAV